MLFTVDNKPDDDWGEIGNGVELETVIAPDNSIFTQDTRLMAGMRSFRV